MPKISLRAIKAEVNSEHKKNIIFMAKLEALYLSTTVDDELVRLLLIPGLYSAWERTFKLSCGLCFKAIAKKYKKIDKCPISKRGAWFRKNSYFLHHLSLIKSTFEFMVEVYKEDSVSEVNKLILKKKGLYKNTEEIIKHLDGWVNGELARPDFTGLVITHSNVNPDVVRLNAQVIGLDIESKTRLSTLDLSKLDELVARRNDIGHGENIDKPPGVKETRELFDYTKKIINDFTTIVLDWMTELENA